MNTMHNPAFDHRLTQLRPSTWKDRPAPSAGFLTKMSKRFPRAEHTWLGGFEPASEWFAELGDLISTGHGPYLLGPDLSAPDDVCGQPVGVWANEALRRVGAWVDEGRQVQIRGSVIHLLLGQWKLTPLEVEEFYDSVRRVAVEVKWNTGSQSMIAAPGKRDVLVRYPDVVIDPALLGFEPLAIAA